VTRCLHFTAGCTTGWANYANEPSQACDVIRLTRSKATVWTVDDVARLIDFLKIILIYLFIYLFFTLDSILMDDKIRSITNSTKVYCTLFII